MSFEWKIVTMKDNDNPIDVSRINNTRAMAQSLEPGGNRDDQKEKETIKDLIERANGKNNASKYKEARGLLNQAFDLLRGWTADGARK